MDSRIITGVVSIFAAIIILAAVMVPVIQDAGYTTTTQTISITNEGEADLKLSKISSGFALDMTVENDGSDLTITNGTGTITAGISPMFILSTDTAAIYVNDVNDVIAVWTSGGTTQQYTIEGDFTVQITESYLVINDGVDHNLPLPTSYMFIPSSTGMYGSFIEGELNKVPTDPVIAAGYYAGVAAYNADTTLGDALTETVIATDDMITSVSWNIPSPDDLQLDPDNIQIQPFNPGDIQIQPIDLDEGAQLMTIPTPTYNDGVWGYDLDGNNNAVIVSYSGSDTDITIPATVGGYPVTTIGKGGNYETVFDVNLGDFSLIIPSNVTRINNFAFYENTNLKSITIDNGVTTLGTYSFCASGITEIVLPASITTINTRCFQACSSLTSVIIKSEITSLPTDCFKNCTSLAYIELPRTLTGIGSSAFDNTALTSIVIPQNVSSIGNNALRNNTLLKQVLNLSEVSITTTSYGLNADSVQDHIDAVVYLAPDNYTATEEIKTPNEYAPLYNILPLIILGSILLATAGIMILRRE